MNDGVRITKEEAEDNRRRVLNALHLSGMTVREFSDEYGIPYPTLYSWVQRKSIPRTFVANLIERVVAAELRAGGRLNPEEAKAEQF